MKTGVDVRCKSGVVRSVMVGCLPGQPEWSLSLLLRLLAHYSLPYLPQTARPFIALTRPVHLHLPDFHLWRCYGGTVAPSLTTEAELSIIKRGIPHASTYKRAFYHKSFIFHSHHHAFPPSYRHFARGFPLSNLFDLLYLVTAHRRMPPGHARFGDNIHDFGFAW